jgi:hypothetical protein
MAMSAELRAKAFIYRCDVPRCTFHMVAEQESKFPNGIPPGWLCVTVKTTGNYRAVGMGEHMLCPRCSFTFLQGTWDLRRHDADEATFECRYDNEQNRITKNVPGTKEYN